MYFNFCQYRLDVFKTSHSAPLIKCSSKNHFLKFFISMLNLNNTFNALLKMKHALKTIIKGNIRGLPRYKIALQCAEKWQSKQCYTQPLREKFHR